MMQEWLRKGMWHELVSNREVRSRLRPPKRDGGVGRDAGVTRQTRFCCNPRFRPASRGLTRKEARLPWTPKNQPRRAARCKVYHSRQILC